ncbi:MAG: FtsQ-type POTRA domain-containing protein [Deltaproteobacteria bacterium]|nr:FtsQ-type POTRA domain-containing protein [Deltaproteobacteria bacterium]
MTSASRRVYIPRPRSKIHNRRITNRTAVGNKPRIANFKVKIKFGLWLFGTVALVGVAIAAYYMGREFIGGQHLIVHKLEIVGNQRADTKELAALAGINIGENLLTIDLDNIAEQVLHHPWVASAQVRRRLPDKVIIELNEHKPAIIVSVGGVYLANNSGQLFKRLVAQDNIELPVFTGLSRVELEQHPEQSANKVKQAIALVQSYSNTADSSMILDEVHFDSYLGWSIVTGPYTQDAKNTTRLFLGFAPLSRLEAAIAAMKAVRGKGARPATIYADAKKNPNRIQVKLTATPQTSKRTVIATAQ